MSTSQLWSFKKFCWLVLVCSRKVCIFTGSTWTEQPGTDGMGRSRSLPPRCSSRSCLCCTSLPLIPLRPRTPSCTCVLFTKSRGEPTWPSSLWCICEQSCPQIIGSWEEWPFCVTSSKFLPVDGQCYQGTQRCVSFVPGNCLITLFKLKSWSSSTVCVSVFISIFKKTILKSCLLF